MERAKQKRKPDIVLKNYWRENEEFADFFNAVLFEGRPVIKPEELEELDTEESSTLEHRDYVESIKASRDSIKICKRSTALGTELIMLALEDQEHIHYAMPRSSCIMEKGHGMEQSLSVKCCKSRKNLRHV